MPRFVCGDAEVKYTLTSFSVRYPCGHTLSYIHDVSPYVFAVVLGEEFEVIVDDREGAEFLASAWVRRADAGTDVIASVYSLDQTDDIETLWTEKRGGIPSRVTKLIGSWDRNGPTSRAHPGITVGN